MEQNPVKALDRSSELPLYMQVAAWLTQAIADGSTFDGSRLPSERVLAADFRVSVPTIHQAVNLMVDRGLLVRRRGIGTSIVDRPPPKGADLSPGTATLILSGDQQEFEVVSCCRAYATAQVATALRLPARQPVWQLVVVARAERTAVGLMRHYLPDPGIDIATIGIAEHGLYTALMRSGIGIAKNALSIGARGATKEEAQALGIAIGLPVMTGACTTYAQCGQVIEYGAHAYRADRCEYALTTVLH